VIASLRRRAALGAVDDDELAARISRARTAMTHAGLDGLLMDLPADPDPDADPLPTAGPTGPTPPAWADLDTGAATTGAPPSATAPVTIPIGRAATSVHVPDHRPPPPTPPGVPDPRASVLRASQLTPILVAVVVVAAFAILIVGTVARNGSSDSDPSQISEEVAVPPTTAEPTTTTTAPAPAETVPPAPPPGPPPTAEHQELVVGVDITAGRHMQPDGMDCYWEVRDGTGESFAFGGSDRPVLDVRDGEVVVLDFCGALVPYAPPAAPATSVGSGDWLVGEDLVAGTYRPSATDDFCIWERASGFRHDFDELIEWDDTRRDVAVRDGERFSSAGCGTWNRV
jgi:hypothetical protein